MTPTPSRLSEIEAFHKAEGDRSLGENLDAEQELWDALGEALAIARAFEASAKEGWAVAKEALPAERKRAAAAEERAERAEGELVEARKSGTGAKAVYAKLVEAVKERDAARAAEKDADAWAKANVAMARKDAEKARSEADALRDGLEQTMAWVRAGDRVEALKKGRAALSSATARAEEYEHENKTLGRELHETGANAVGTRGRDQGDQGPDGVAGRRILAKDRASHSVEPAAARPADGMRYYTVRTLDDEGRVQTIIWSGWLKGLRPDVLAHTPAPAPPSKAICGVCGEPYEGDGPGGKAHGHGTPPPEACEIVCLTDGRHWCLAHNREMRPACPSRSV